MKDKLMFGSNPFLESSSIFERFIDSNKEDRAYFVPGENGILQKLRNQDPVEFNRQMLGEPWTNKEHKQ